LSGFGQEHQIEWLLEPFVAWLASEILLLLLLKQPSMNGGWPANIGFQCVNLEEELGKEEEIMAGSGRRKKIGESFGNRGRIAV
jgi:hypothetical protein